MKKKAFTISLARNPAISLQVIPGHFTTSRLHMNHYLDLDNLKTSSVVAREVARELAVPYLAHNNVDTIVCMEKTEVIGAYLAEELSRNGTTVPKTRGEIHIISPLCNVNRNLTFKNNMQDLIYNRNIILLISSVSSGITLSSALECITYYGARVIGISALFNANPEMHEHEIYSMFTNKDIPGYETYKQSDCPMCKASHKLDAIIVQDGYITIY